MVSDCRHTFDVSVDIVDVDAAGNDGLTVDIVDLTPTLYNVLSTSLTLQRYRLVLVTSKTSHSSLIFLGKESGAP
jgi:hypothetical protein